MPRAPPSWLSWSWGSSDVALARECPPMPRDDVVLAVEALGVVLATVQADKLADNSGIRLHRLAGLDWTGFPRSQAPVWYDQIVATLRAHGMTHWITQSAPGEGSPDCRGQIRRGRHRTRVRTGPARLGPDAAGRA